VVGFFDSMNPFKGEFWTDNKILSPSNLVTGGGRNLVGSLFKRGGGTFADTYYKPLTPGGKQDVKTANDRATANANASADAKIRQAEYEEQAAMGAQRTRAKRRRGFSSTILTGGPTTLDGGSAYSGKTLLGE
jgi:hypothetical protein